MRVTLLARNLSEALAVAEKAVAKGGHFPALGSVLLEAADETLTLTGTDTYHRAQRGVSARVLDAGAVLLPPKAIGEYLDAVPSDDAVTITVDGAHKATLTCGRTVARVAGLDVDGFPTAPVVDETATDVTLGAAVFARLVASVKHAVAPDDSRPVLAGICITLADGELQMVAADSHRLAVRSEAVAAPGETPDLALIAHGERLAEVGKALGRATSVRLRLSERQSHLLLDAETGSWAVRLIEGQYPDWRRILPTPDRAKTLVTLARPDLLRASKLIRGLATVTEDDKKRRYSVVKAQLAVAGGALTVSASGGTRDHEATATLDADQIGEDAAIAFNGSYLRDAIDALDGERLTLEIVGPGSPAVLREAGVRNGHLHVLMPMSTAR